MSKRIIITDAVAPVCKQLLEEAGFKVDEYSKLSQEELKEASQGAHGWIVRSGTKINEELIEHADVLEVIGRAGVGVDNVDLGAATRKGVLVLNAPDGNTISTAEHTCAMIMSLSRLIPQANESLTSGKWERKNFMGSELYSKTLGIVGVGKIGQTVAERMKSFGMNLLGFDPVLSQEAADKLGIRLVGMDELLVESDFITVHTPLTDSTRGMLNKDSIQKCKDGVRLINCARGGIIDESQLYDLVESGKVGGAALDVYSSEPPTEELYKLVSHPRIITTPHIAASTDEAQEKVAIQVTEELINALSGQPVMTPVNSLAIKMATESEVKPLLKVANTLGIFAGQLASGRMKSLHVTCKGDIPSRYSNIITIGAVAGALDKWNPRSINYVNALSIAEESGIGIDESRTSDGGPFSKLISVEVNTGESKTTVSGTIFGPDDVRIVGIDDFDIEFQPHGHVLYFQNEDKPGMMAAVSGLLAAENVNIAAVSLGRKSKGDRAVTIMKVDQDVPEGTLVKIRSIEGVYSVKTLLF